MNCYRKTLLLLTSVVVLFMFASITVFGQTVASSSTQPVSTGNLFSGPRIWLQENQPLPVQHVTASQGIGSPVSLTGLGQSQPVSMTSGDLDGDGFDDLVVGYSSGRSGFISVQLGNLDAFAPQSPASFHAIERGEFPSPFLLEAKTFNVPVTPDFMVLGSFAGSGNKDLVVAAKGGNALYVFPGDGKGNFGAPQTVNLTGRVTALATGNLGRTATLVVGLSGGGKNFSLGTYVSTPQGLTALATYPLANAASNILFGDFGDAGPDAAFLSGGQIQILRSSTMQLTKVTLPVSAQAFALGSFVYDRNGGSQIALVALDGSIQIAVRNEFDPRTFTVAEFNAIRQARLRNQTSSLLPVRSFPVNGWKIVESFPGAAALGSGQAPVMFRTRASSNGADDVMVLNAFSGQLTLISHPDSKPGAQTFTAGQISLRPYSGTPVAALPMRINVDGRPGVMALHKGEIAPSMIMPIPDPTFTVNTTNDTVDANPGDGICADSGGQCSLRAAIMEANATAGTDTIMVPAGTFTLTLPRAASPAYDATTGTLNVNDSVNIIGAGQNSTIIQAGTTAYNQGTPNGVDMVMAVNEDIAIISNATASLSNLTIQNGHNQGTHGNDGDGGCMEFDTGSSGTANLNLTNVTLQNCDTTQGNGAGLVTFNFTNPNNGLATIANSIIQGNSAADTSAPGTDAVGGGIWVTDPSQMTMSNSQVLNNLAIQTSGGGAGFGGGIYIISGGGPQQTQIHASTISGNQSSFAGGGIFDSANLLIDQGTIISGNKNGQNGAGPQDGAGLFVDPELGLSATLTQVTITGNQSTGTGGGIATGAGGAGSVTITFSRFAGNTAGTTGSNLENFGSAVTATDDWWGTNNPSSTIHNTAGTTTFDPFIVLTHGGNPQKIRINQSSTLTGDMSADNHGIAVGLSNLTQIIGLPITFNNPVLGTIPDAQPETLNANAQATATFNAGGTGGFGTANATVDQAVVPVNSNLIASATESSSTATIATVGAHGFTTGEQVTISGVGVSGYNGTFRVASTPDAVTFTYTANTSGLGPSSGGTANAGILILQPPSITKSFNPTTVAVTSVTAIFPSTITISITNGNTVAIDSSFTDSLPTGLVVATPPNANNTCGGTLTATAGTSSISFANPSLAPGTCTIHVDVVGTVDNTYSNSVTINSADAGNGNTATANLTVINAPFIAKAFGAATIPLNGTTSLTFTLTSTNTNLTLNGVAFTDSLPAGLVVATPGNLTNTCGGTATAANGSSLVALSGANLAPGASCTVSVNVQGTTAGVKSNSVSVTSTNGGNGNTSNASITVVSPPTLAKAFGAASIPLNGTTSLNFSINNPNSSSTLTGIGFTDTLPAGLVVSTPNGLTGSCGAGTITATVGTNVISLSGASLPASGSCTFAVNVTGIAAGTQNNTSGNITSNEGGTGNAASASINVDAPPSIAKVFNPSTIALNATTSLTFTITNPAANVDPQTGVAFTDTLPTGLTVASGTSTVCGGTLTTTAPTGISLSGATIAVNSNCQFSVTVTGAASGQYTNTTSNVTSTNGGPGNTASANLTVASPPSITKAFGASTIPLNGTTSLTFTIQNPNTGVTLTGLAFTDTLPAGLVVATPNNLSNTCGGTASATAGSSSVSLSAGTLAGGSSCTVSVNVQGTTAGLKNNSVQVTSTEGGTGNTSNASITVVAPATIQKQFGAASIALNSSTSLSFTINNPNVTALSGVGFSDPLPAGLIISTPNGLTGSCGGGTITATQNTNVISLSGANLAAGTSCTFSVNVTGTAAGQQNNTTSAVTSNEGGTGGTASASIKVEAPPSIAKAFNPAAIALNATTSLTFTITNPAANVDPQTGVAFTDTLPTGLTVASSTATVCGGTLTTTAPTSIALSGATIAVNSNCQFSVTVTGSASGQYTNTTSNVTSTNGGTGNTASANLTVASAPNITKAFGASTIPLNGTTSLTFTIQNPNTGVTLTGIAFTDSLPAGLVVATPSNLNNTCGGTATATTGSGSVSLSGGTLASSASCTVSVNIQGTTAGVKNNSVTVSSTEGGTGNTSTASITVVAPAAIMKQFGAATIPLSGTTSLSFTIQNSNSVGLTGIGFSDTLPSGLVISTPNGLTGSCGSGTITATQNTGVISLSGGSLAANTSCTFSVNVTGTSAGTKNNTTSGVTSNEGGTGGAASASIIVVAPPSIAKVFTPSSIAVNATTQLGFTITNPSSNAVALTGVGFTDVLPASLTIANGSSSVCGGTLTISGDNTITLSGASIAVNSSCAFSVIVTATQPGSFVNTTSNVTSANGGTGNTATSTLTVNGVTVNPTSVNFGDVDAQQVVTTAVTVTNGGSTSVPISVSITPGTGANANNFAAVNNCPSTLAANSSCTITIVFVANQPANSSGVGISTATLNVVSVNTVNVPLQANVIDPEPVFSPNQLNFGNVTVGSMSTQTINVSNTGLTALVINTVTISGTNPGDFSAANHCTSPVAPGGSCTISVTFMPTVKGNRSANLVVNSNDGTNTIPLSGKGK